MISAKNTSFNYEPKINGAKVFLQDALSIDSNPDLDYESKEINGAIKRPTDSLNLIVKPTSPNSKNPNEKYNIKHQRETAKSILITESNTK